MTTIQFPEWEKEKKFEEMNKTKEGYKTLTMAGIRGGFPPDGPDDFFKIKHKPYVSDKLIRLAKRIHEEGNDNRARQLIKIVAKNHEMNYDNLFDTKKQASLNEFYDHNEGVIRGLAKAATQHLFEQSMPKQDASKYLGQDLIQQKKLGQDKKTCVLKDVLDDIGKSDILTKTINQYATRDQKDRDLNLPITNQGFMYTGLNPEKKICGLEKADGLIQNKNLTNLNYKMMPERETCGEAYFNRVSRTL